jgi:hypothetical protein
MRLLVEWTRVCVWLAAVVKKNFLKMSNVNSRKLKQRWTHVMEYALWFYGEDEFPVFQCVCPDLNNRFPWNDGFDTTWRDRQALLFQDAIPSTVERDFDFWGGCQAQNRTNRGNKNL